MIKPEIEVCVWNIENHQNKTAVSADLFQNFNRPIPIGAFAVFMLNGINDIRYHNHCHNGKSIIIKPIHNVIITKTTANFNRLHGKNSMALLRISEVKSSNQGNITITKKTVFKNTVFFVKSQYKTNFIILLFRL